MQSKMVYVNINFIEFNHMWQYYSHHNCSKMEVFDWKTWGKWMHSTSVVCTKGASYIAINVSLQPTHPRQHWPHLLSASMLCALTHITRCQEWRIAFLNALVALLLTSWFLLRHLALNHSKACLVLTVNPSFYCMSETMRDDTSQLAKV